MNVELPRKVTCKNSLNEGRRRIVIFSVKICHRMIFNFFVPVSCPGAELAEQSRALQRMSLITVEPGLDPGLQCKVSSQQQQQQQGGEQLCDTAVVTIITWPVTRAEMTSNSGNTINTLQSTHYNQHITTLHITTNTLQHYTSNIIKHLKNHLQWYWQPMMRDIVETRD